MRNDVEKFIDSLAGGRTKIKNALGIQYATIISWEKNGEIPRKHLLELEVLARNNKCFSEFKRAAVARGNYNRGKK